MFAIVPVYHLSQLSSSQTLADCLYQNQWATAAKITKSISSYTEKLGVSPERAYELYKTHGTCLKGLLLENLIDMDTGAEDFLHAAHDINYDDIGLDPEVGVCAAVDPRVPIPLIEHTRPLYSTS